MPNTSSSGISKPFPTFHGLVDANRHDGRRDDEIPTSPWATFQGTFITRIICIGALIRPSRWDHWIVKFTWGHTHVGERSEKELITAFVSRIAELGPQLVTFSGSSFALPVLRYGAMTHKVSAIVCRHARTSIGTPKMQSTCV